MGKRDLIVQDNLRHNVPAMISEAGESLRAFVLVYFRTEVAGQAKATIEAKRRDLGRFIGFYENLYGHDNADEWFASVTREFIKQAARSGMSAASLARLYASVRHFARWIEKKIRPFPLGCPTDGIRPPKEPEPEWKGLSRADELRLLNAAQTLRVRPGNGTNQGLRDHAILMVLLGSGLRVSELVGLSVDQYTGKAFRKVLTKGNYIREQVFLQRDARVVLDEWLQARGQRPGPVFLTRSDSPLSRQQVHAILQRIAAQAGAHRGDGNKISVSPHVLRHTFLRKLAEEKGVQYAKEASGHRSDRYIWRYVRPSSETLAQAVDELE